MTEWGNARVQIVEIDRDAAIAADKNKEQTRPTTVEETPATEVGATSTTVAGSQ